MSEQFKPGDMVECVDASGTPGRVWLVDKPQVGQRYTVTGFSYNHTAHAWQVFLREISNDSGDGWGFAAGRFRLVKPPATDISIFREIVREVFDKSPVA